MTQAHGIRAHGWRLCISEGLCGTAWVVEGSEGVSNLRKCVLGGVAALGGQVS